MTIQDMEDRKEFLEGVLDNLRNDWEVARERNRIQQQVECLDKTIREARGR